MIQSKKYQLGLIGLGTMGKNLLMNMSDSGFAVAGYDKDLSKVRSLQEDSNNIYGAETIQGFVQILEKPRRFFLLVPAGKIVDYVIADLMPFLEEGDIVIDGGNSYFKDTQRRQQQLSAKGIHFLGIGVSGGAEGARRGPSMMPGGNKNAYATVRPILEAVAAKIGKQPCVTYLGEGAVGHFVKMVHNGIEYAMMQLLAEAYDLMKRGMGMSNADIQTTFSDWNNRELQSFLVEISATIMGAKDDLTEEGDLIDVIMDKGKQKGTGKWTSQEALDLGIAVPAIDMAVIARILSAFRQERQQAAQLLEGPASSLIKNGGKTFVRRLRKAVLFGFLVSYAQGMAMLKDASDEYGFDLDLEGVARIWRGGCIIRAKLLEDFRRAYKRQPDLPNLLLDKSIAKKINATQKDTRTVIAAAAKAGIPVPCLMASLAYYDSYRSGRLPMNLVQGQRDYFGAHTYERLDREGGFHYNWIEKK